VTSLDTAASGARGGGGFVVLGIPDVNGSIRGKALRPAAFKAAVEGGAVVTDLLLALDPADQPITDYERFGIRAGAGDMIVRPEPETLRELSWRPGWQLCLATPAWLDGTPCDLAVREVLRRTLAGLAELGYEVLAAFEYEVRVRDAEGGPLSSGISYSAAEVLRFEELVARLEPALAALGIELSAVHTEAGPGLLELNIAERPGLRAADDAALLKLAVKEVSASLGLRASFLAKTTAGQEGSSGHIHFSCWRDGENAFAASEAQEQGKGMGQGAGGGRLAAPLTNTIAGLLDHLAGASLLLNPTINSYKRLVPGYFAPVNASWGIENRSAAIRVIRSPRPERCRIECRRPGADANPYLALAALAAAAADGIQRGAQPPPPVTGDASERPDLPPLPASLESALQAFLGDGLLRHSLGESFSEYYAVSRTWELKAWQQAVSDWERDRYERAV
jgi:glutamine synthetase